MKTKITATDKIGREETITLNLDAKTKKMLEIHEDTIPYLLDQYYYGQYQITMEVTLTKSQYYKLKNFMDLINQKFYNYTITIA